MYDCRTFVTNNEKSIKQLNIANGRSMSKSPSNVGRNNGSIEIMRTNSKSDSSRDIMTNNPICVAIDTIIWDIIFYVSKANDLDVRSDDA
jgi:hypothetical protein